MTALLDFFANYRPGKVPNGLGVDRVLASCWDLFTGSSECGMKAHKLLGRMEQIRWESPILSFVIERHGGTVCRSTRAELQHWEVDVENWTARIVKTGQRQLTKMAPRVSVKQIAEEIASRILSGEADDRLQRLDDGTVKVLVSRIFPDGSGFKRTVSGRRKRLLEEVAERLVEHRWVEASGGRFVPPTDSTMI